MSEKKHLYEYNYDMPETSGIYSIMNNINSHEYIGQAEFLPARAVLLFHEHNIPLQRAYERYGIDNFSIRLVEECAIDDLDEREIYWIKELHTHVKDPDCRGYNLTIGGKGCRGVIYSEETCKLRSERMIGNTINVGRTPTDIARAHMRASAPKKHSLEHNKRVSESLRLRGVGPTPLCIERSKEVHKERMKGNTLQLNRIKVSRGYSEEKSIYPEELEYYESQGWKKGVSQSTLDKRKATLEEKGHTRRSPTIYIHNDNIKSLKRISPESLHEYENLGYEKGYKKYDQV